jgi:transcriptional regulator
MALGTVGTFDVFLLLGLRDMRADITEDGPIRTQEEVAQIMTERGYPMTRAWVSHLEAKAMKKIKRHPAIQAIAKELLDQNTK